MEAQDPASSHDMIGRLLSRLDRVELNLAQRQLTEIARHHVRIHDLERAVNAATVTLSSIKKSRRALADSAPDSPAASGGASAPAGPSASGGPEPPQTTGASTVTAPRLG